MLSDENMGLSLMNLLGLSSSVRIAHIAFYWKFFLLHYIQVLCQYRLYRADHAYLTYLMLQWQISHLNGRKLDHRQVSALIFSLSGFILSYTADMFILMILYDFRLFPPQFYYIILYIRKVESCMQIADRCAFWKFPLVRRTLFCMRCNFKRYMSAVNSQAGKA
jgi:hypothetical protein